MVYVVVMTKMSLFSTVFVFFFFLIYGHIRYFIFFYEFLFIYFKQT